MERIFGRPLFLSDFTFDDEAVFLNHGSYGAVPRVVQEKQRQLKAQMEKHPDSWFRRECPRLWRENVDLLSSVVGATPENLVLVDNVTYGLNTIIRSLLQSGSIGSGDAIMVTSLQYHQVKILCEEVTKENHGINLRTMDLAFPLNSKSDIIQAYTDYLDKHPEIKLAIVDHISSPTSVLLPVREITEVCKERDVIVAVDGAHVFGQLPLEIETLNVDFYTGNIHKWGFSARCLGFLWVSARWRSIIRPAVVSHFHGFDLQCDFCVRGTCDTTAYYTFPTAVDFMKSLGGMEAVSAYCRKLAGDAVRHLVETWHTEEISLSENLKAPYMRLVLIPGNNIYPETAAGCGDLETDLFEKFNIQTSIFLVRGRPYIRLSTAVYNDMTDYVKLGEAVTQLTTDTRKAVKLNKGYQLPLMHWDLTPIVSVNKDQD